MTEHSVTEVSESDVEILRDLMRAPLTTAGLREWELGSTARGKLLQNSIWGSIEWPKGLGRPATPSLAAAFVIQHTSYWQKWTAEPGGGFVQQDGWISHPTPITWDGPEDDTHYRVSFMSPWGVPYRVGEQGPNRIGVDFAPYAPWPVNLRLAVGYKRIEPPSAYFEIFDFEQRWALLDPFEVIQVPWRLAP
jgi:hypothetical protein